MLKDDERTGTGGRAGSDASTAGAGDLYWLCVRGGRPGCCCD
jgi:hypothetical protein